MEAKGKSERQQGQLGVFYKNLRCLVLLTISVHSMIMTKVHLLSGTEQTIRKESYAVHALHKEFSRKSSPQGQGRFEKTTHWILQQRLMI